jgi:hypothetical protein
MPFADLRFTGAGVGTVAESAKPRVAIGIFHDIDRLRSALDRLGEAGCSAADVILLSESGALDGALGRLAGGDADGTRDGAGAIQVITRKPDGSDGGWISAGYDESRSRLTRQQILHFETWLASRFADDLDGQLSRGGCLLICPTLDPDHEKIITSVLLRHAADSVQVHDIRSTG